LQDHPLEDIHQPDDVGMVAKGTQKYHLAVGALGIGFVTKSIEYLLQGHGVLVSLVSGLPNDAVGTFPQALNELFNIIMIYV